MAQQHVVWTCLPQGLTEDGRGLRVAVLLSPRLNAQGDPPQLASFPEWLDWPSTVREAVFTFWADAQPVLRSSLAEATGPTRHDPHIGTPDSAVWRALFRPDFRVEGYRFKDELLDSQINSYSTTDIQGLVQSLYVDLARRSATELPRIGADLLADPAWKALVDAVRDVDRWGSGREQSKHLMVGEGETAIERRFGGLRGLSRARAGSAPLAQQLARFELFHTPPLRPLPLQAQPRRDDSRIESHSQGFERPPQPSLRELVDSLDFHRVVAAMNGYPVLQRRLGLVFDFVLDRSQWPQNADFTLRVEVDLPGLRTPLAQADVTPFSQVRHEDRAFFARSNPALNANDALRIDRGLLDLYAQPDRYAVLQADVDGAGLKLMNFARTLGGFDAGAQADPALLHDDVSRQDKRSGAPALRTAGLMLVRRDRAVALQARLQANRQQAQEAATPGQVPVLWAEDLVRGYRIDAWDAQTGVWRSLCRRLAEYRLGAGADPLVVQPEGGEEEATVQLAATRSPDPTYNPQVINLHEALVSWTGWSLGAPPPGLGIGDDLRPGADGKPPFTDGAQAVPGLDLQSRYQAVPGSLPRLRYGRRYALRARAVDLAGGSLPPAAFDFGPEQPAAAAQVFARFEPIAAPALALARPPGGPTLRPQEGESMARMAIRSFNDIHDDPTPSAQTARRHAVPAQTTVREAELHGALDAGGVLDASTFQMLAQDRDRDARDPAAALVEEVLPMKGPTEAVAVDTTYAVWREGMTLTYLPDPMAQVVSAWFLDHPAQPETATLHIPLMGPEGWPAAQPFAIELFEDAADPLAKPFFDAEARVLRVPLPKGHRATLRLAIRPSKRDLFERLGLWQWLDPATQQQLAELALDGRCWLFTPWQDVELVHAVQRPLIRPAIRQIEVQRELGRTDARPRLLADCSLRSTDRMDLHAQWNEPDAPTNMPTNKPTNRAREDLAFHVKITDERDYVPGPDAYPDHTQPADEQAGEDVIGINSGRRDWVARKAHEFNDTRYRRIAYRLTATSRYREYLPPGLLLEPDPATAPGPYQPVDRHLTVEGPPAVSWIPSSAPPPAVQVLYVVPTFGWERSSDEQGAARSHRRGGGLRVYLGGRWNLSGYGEMLAVVLPPAGFGGNPDAQPAASPYKSFVTQWGNDPIWESPSVAGLAPARRHFRRARWQADSTGAWLPPDAPASEADQAPGPFPVQLRPPAIGSDVEVAPHDVFYDAERGLWFCDIEIDPQRAYWPFVRLALARYQPCSVYGAHLSEIVLADFMALTADRWLSVTPEREGRSRRITVHGHGYSASGGSREVRLRPVANVWAGQVTDVPPVSATSVIEVSLERLDPALGEDFGWQPVAQGVPMPGDWPWIAAATLNLAANGIKARLDNGLLDYRPSPLWDGRIELPAPSDAAPRLRLAIAEYEEYPIDAAPADTAVANDRGATDHSVTRTGRRLVFLEHVPVA